VADFNGDGRPDFATGDLVSRDVTIELNTCVAPTPTPTPTPAPTPSISLNDLSLAEGDSGTTPFIFTVSLSAAGSQTVSANYTTLDNTAHAGSDYQATNGVVTFSPGEISKQITVLVNGDTQVEGNESFVVSLYNINNASAGKA